MEADFDANTLLKADTDNTPSALTVAEQTLVGRITAGVITGLTPTEVRTLLSVEENADVTDATNVAAAGAVMDSDFAGSELGAMTRTGVGTYAIIKHNLDASAAPAATDDGPTNGYAVGSLWIDTTADKVYQCVDPTDDAAVWRELSNIGLLSDSSPAAVGTAASGSGTSASRDDHVHAHGDQAGGTLHADATTSVDGFMTAADKTKLDALWGGSVETFTQQTVDSATPVTVATIAIPTNSVVIIRAYCKGIVNGGGNAAGYSGTWTYKNVSDTVSLVGAANVTTDEDDSSWEFAPAISSTNVLMQVTGPASGTVDFEGMVLTIK
jgi:hypothetical protein